LKAKGAEDEMGAQIDQQLGTGSHQILDLTLMQKRNSTERNCKHRLNVSAKYNTATSVLENCPT